jgi:transcriptional regulator with XRE-family HTH domain
MRSIFSTNLRAALEAADMTQEDLARKVDVSLRSAQGWCLGEKEPRGETLIRVARAVGVPAEDLYASEREAA